MFHATYAIGSGHYTISMVQSFLPEGSQVIGTRYGTGVTEDWPDEDTSIVTIIGPMDPIVVAARLAKAFAQDAVLVFAPSIPGIYPDPARVDYVTNRPDAPNRTVFRNGDMFTLVPSATGRFVALLVDQDGDTSTLA